MAVPSRSAGFVRIGVAALLLTGPVAGCGSASATRDDAGLDSGAATDGSVSLSRDIFPFVFTECATSNCHDRGSVTNHEANFSSAALVHTRWVNVPGMDFCDPSAEPPAYVVKTIVVPGRPAESFLLELLTSTREELCPDHHWPRMPPPPAPPLSAERIELIRRWIAEGALKN